MIKFYYEGESMKFNLRNFIYMLVFISVVIMPLRGESHLLSELLNPSKILIGEKDIYIVDSASIYIYSKNGYKFIKKFGRKGEGPGEIPTSRRGNVSLSIMETKQGLFVQSRNKVIYFDNRGNFKQEKKVKTGFIRGLLPVGKFYTGRAFSFGANRRSATSSVYLFDENLNKKKELFKFNSTSGRGSFFKIFSPGNIFILKTDGDKIYVVNDKSFRIHIFNSTGTELKGIKLNYSLLKVGSAKKESIENYYKNDSNFSSFWSRIKTFFSIDDRYPAIKNFFIDGENIYIQTYYTKGEKVEFFKFSLDGKFQKKPYLTIKSKNPVDDYPFDIRNDRLYQLVEDEDEEEWILNISDIK